MRVAFVSHSSGMAGAERAMLELIRGLKRRGVECLVAVPRSDGPLVVALRRLGVPTVVEGYKWWIAKPHQAWRAPASLALTMATLPRLAVVFRTWRCDVVYTNTLATWVGAAAARLVGKPHVWHVHEFVKEDHGMAFYLGESLSLTLVSKYSELVIANSFAVARKIKKYVNERKVVVVYYSVDVGPEHENFGCSFSASPQPHEIKCVLVGRLEESKGHPDAVKAIGELAGRGLSVELVIVGDGDRVYKQYLERLVSVLGLVDRVKLVGWVDNPYELMKVADVVLMCSRNEAFGRVTVEGMKLGKVVIGTRSGGTAELIQDGVNGLLYSPGDWKGLADSIEAVALDPGLRVSLEENARRFARERFTDELYAGRVLELLDGLVSPPSRRTMVRA